MPTKLLTLLVIAAWAVPSHAQEQGYYRHPALYGDTVVFTAEGDLWTAEVDVDSGVDGDSGVNGGVARRLTSHAGSETHAAIDPSGTRVAFSGHYEGATEVYVMPLGGGKPERLTYDGERAWVVGWTPDGGVLVASNHGTGLPRSRLRIIEPDAGTSIPIPLDGVGDAAIDPSDGSIIFTRFATSSSHFKRYRGGRAQRLWRFHPATHKTSGATSREATPITNAERGTSRTPMPWQGRIYFVSDDDGTFNLWSVDPEGGDPRQHTHHVGWDVREPSLHTGRIVYQRGADLHVYDIARDVDRRLDIRLASDFDQRRERWVQEPMDYLTAAHLSPNGDRVVITARGQVFVAPVGPGRWVEAGRAAGVRHRAARFLPVATGNTMTGATEDGNTEDGNTPHHAAKDLVVLSDPTGEVELWRLDARGMGEGHALTKDGAVLRYDTLPAPNGARIAFVDHDQALSLLDVASGAVTHVDTSSGDRVGRARWSPDSRWLAYSVTAPNLVSRIRLFDTVEGRHLDATTDRFDSYDPSWSADGQFLYFLSDRHLVSTTPGPWGNYAPAPNLDGRTQIFALDLVGGQRSPFAPSTELDAPVNPEDDTEAPAAKARNKKGRKAGRAKPPTVVIQPEGLAQRLIAVPVPPGNYRDLEVNEGHLFWRQGDTRSDRRTQLMAYPIELRRDLGPEPTPETVLRKVRFYELSGDGETLLARQNDRLLVVPANGNAPKKPGEHALSLDHWRFPLDPTEEWRQMLTDAWRLLRDYFYDPGMHGVDWPGMLTRYRPLLDRVTDRDELNDLFAMMTAELSASHHYVRGGDQREGEETDVLPASLGAEMVRDAAAGGHRVIRVLTGDPDMITERSPLAQPGVDVVPGDVIVSINGRATADVAHVGALLRDQAGNQVLLGVRDAATPNRLREVIVEPITPREAARLRYDVWTYERRQRVERLAEGDVGYLHMRAMGSRNYTEFARHYFPVFNRRGLIVDMRGNRGGNIDSWVLGMLQRKPWMWWKPRRGDVYPNMQYAFTGHMVVLCDEHTWSDGEAFCEGFRRLGLGPVIGTRTGGGEIWLTSSNGLVDNGIATAAEFGVYGPEGDWLIEGHGVVPDLEVDNLPHATFNGRDAQLEAAIAYLQKKIRNEPVIVPAAPDYPDKSSDDNRPSGD